jgi:ATP-dependent DNA helicase RecQ
VHTLVSEDDAPLLSALKAKRRFLAEQAGVPAYIIFNDKTLIDMAEKRPATLDDMAHIGGVGAKKLESYGRAFLEVIAGEAENLHPSRRKLAGRDEGLIYDRLLAAQSALIRGPHGADKPMTCSASMLAKVAQLRGADITSLTRLIGERHAERFGDAFLEVLESAA